MLFIKVENNNIVDHPVTLENLQMIYPHFDPKNPSEGYVPFVRASVPAVSSLYIIHDPTYVLSHGVVNEVYIAREMTAEEKQQLFEIMEQRKPFASWILDQERCVWQPPVPYPAGGIKYVWDESTVSWTELI